MPPWWRGPWGPMGSAWTLEPPRICAILRVAGQSVTVTLLTLLYLHTSTEEQSVFWQGEPPAHPPPSLLRVCVVRMAG